MEIGNVLNRSSLSSPITSLLSLHLHMKEKDMSIDYSKWYRLDVSDNDDDDGDDDRDQALPGVTRLDHPSRVVIGPNGPSVVHSAPVATASPFAAAPSVRVQGGHDGNVIDGRAGSGDGADATVQKQQQQQQQRESDVEEEDALTLSALTRNGLRARNGSHYWGQTKTGVTLAFPVPLGTKAKDISDFSIAADEKTLTFCIASSSPPSAGEGKKEKHVVELRYPVKCDEEVLAGCWQLISLTSRSLRLLVFSFEKKAFGFASALWWERALATEQEQVDTAALVDRKVDPEKAQQVQNAWAEAHKEFIQSRKNRQHGAEANV